MLAIACVLSASALGQDEYGDRAPPVPTVSRPVRPRGVAPAPLPLPTPSATPRRSQEKEPFGGNLRPLGPLAGGDPSQGEDSWEIWWFFHRDRFLAPRSAVPTGLPPRLAPALRRILDVEGKNDLVTAALMAVGKIGEPAGHPAESSAIPRILRRLGEGNQEIAASAALALGILRCDDSIPRLADLLAAEAPGQALVGGREVSARIRAFAAYGLGLAVERTATNRERQRVARDLTVALADAETPVDVQCAALLALSLDRLEPETVESSAAPWISRQSLVRYLMRFARDPARVHLSRAHAVTALGRLAAGLPETGRIEVVDFLVALLQREARSETEVALSAIQALGALADAGSDPADRAARSALMAELGASAFLARGFALVALSEIGGRATEDDLPGVFETRAALIHELLEGSSSIRSWAALALGVLERGRRDVGRPPDELVRRMLMDGFAAARARTDVGAGAIALGLCRETRAESSLRSKLEATSQDTGQGYVALSLGMIRARAAAPSLRRILLGSSNSPQLLEHASTALALLGDRGCTVEFVIHLRETKSLAEQAAVARALGRIGDARSLDALLGILEREDLPGSTRGFAAAAIGSIVEATLLPWRTPIVEGINYRAIVPSLASGDGTGIFEIL